jgi:hypothetical protein
MCMLLKKPSTCFRWSSAAGGQSTKVVTSGRHCYHNGSLNTGAVVSSSLSAVTGGTRRTAAAASGAAAVSAALLRLQVDVVPQAHAYHLLRQLLEIAPLLLLPLLLLLLHAHGVGVVSQLQYSDA